MSAELAVFQDNAEDRFIAKLRDTCLTIGFGHVLESINLPVFTSSVKFFLPEGTLRQVVAELRRAADELDAAALAV